MRGRFLVGVFNHGHASQDVAVAEYLIDDAADDLGEAVVEDGAVIDGGPVAFAQADEHHLHQAAFDVADESGMWLDAIEDHDVVGLEGVAVEMHVETLGRSADHDGIHAGTDGAAQGFFGDPVRRQDSGFAPRPWPPP